MQIGIGIPNSVVGTTGAQLLEWARSLAFGGQSEPREMKDKPVAAATGSGPDS